MFKDFLLKLRGWWVSRPSARTETGLRDTASPFAGLKIKHMRLADPAVTVADAFVFEQPPVRSPDTVALYYPEQHCVVIRDPYTGAAARFIEWDYPQPLQPLFGDWNGDGRQGFGLFDPEAARAILYDGFDFATPAHHFAFGRPGADWVALVGDWDGDGKETIGLFDPAMRLFMLHNRHEEGLPDLFFPYGPPDSGWLPLSGNWGKAQKDSVGLYDPADRIFWLKHEPTHGLPDMLIRNRIAKPGLIPMAGDWEGLGSDTVGLYDPANGVFFMNHLKSGKEQAFRFGGAGVVARPLAVQWDESLQTA